MGKKIHWGILGTGKIAHTFAQDILLSELAVLYGVASRTFDRARSFGIQYKCIKYYGTYEELASDPAIDVLYVATPHTFHFENTIMSLEKGKAVICEKPLGMNQKQLQMMIDIARRKDLFLMEGMWTRFIPATEVYLGLIDKAAIGDVITLHADFGFKAPYDPDSRLFNKALGGGALLDIGIYPLFLSLITLGMPSEVKAMARMTPTRVDSYCSVLLDYDHSAKAVLESTFETETPTEATIYGAKGRIMLHQRFHHTEKITLYTEAGSEDFVIPYKGNGYVHEIDEVNDCLLQGKTESPKLPLKLSLDLITLIDRVKEEIELVY
jgi:predicted dehydrogenase